MLRILSTYVFIKRKLNAALVADIARSGVSAVEIFCARGHFEYRSADAVREMVGVLQDNGLTVHALHAPAERDFHPTRESATALSVSDTERTRRVEAVDEIKRVLDLAEHLKFRYLVQHLGTSRDTADPRRFDAAYNSLEHLHIFAKQRGVTIALENTPGELATPANLRQFIADTRLTDLRLCFDTGHAHLAASVLPSFETMRELVVTSHVHDNHGEKDEHLAPPSGTIDWSSVLPVIEKVPMVLELKEIAAWAEPAPASVALDVAARGAFEFLEEQGE